MKRLVFLTVLFLVGESFASENSNKYLDRLERMEEPSKSIVRLTALLHPQRFVRIVCLGNHGTIAKREVDKIKRTPLHSPMVLQRLLDEIKEEESKLIPTYQTNAWLVHYYSRELGLSDILSTSKNELL